MYNFLIFKNKFCSTFPLITNQVYSYKLDNKSEHTICLTKLYRIGGKPQSHFKDATLKQKTKQETRNKRIFIKHGFSRFSGFLKTMHFHKNFIPGKQVNFRQFTQFYRYSTEYLFLKLFQRLVVKHLQPVDLLNEDHDTDAFLGILLKILALSLLPFDC